jgi:septum formation protein
MLIQKLKDYRIILASKSPRRQFLLKEAGIDFEVIDDLEVPEDYPSDLYHSEIPVYLAKLKASAYADKLQQQDILITADTIVWMNNLVYNKPVDYNDAYGMLRAISGSMSFS